MPKPSCLIKSGSITFLVVCLLGVGLTLAALSQNATGQQMQAGASGRGGDSLGDLRFRNLGPAVAGGRVAAVAGVPGNPNVIYVGAAGGGVWKSVDGGNSFKPIFEKYPASIGAIAVAPSNPSLVWVGTGESNPRNDVMDGHGVYFSADAGNSWRLMGLADVGQISHVVIDPYDPNTVLVAALGHVWAPNSERGVFRTTDGGKTWHRVQSIPDTPCDLESAMAT